MKIPSKFFIASMAAGAVILASGCSENYAGKEKTHPLYVKAGSAQNAGNYQEAAKLYEEFLYIAPKSYETHLKLATLYSDNLDSPLKAVYHYGKYGELNPSDSTNADDIKSFAELAKKRLYEKLREELRDSASDAALKEELAKTTEKLKKYVEYDRLLRKQNELMRERIKAHNISVSASQNRPSPSVRPPAQPAPSRASSQIPNAGTYKVKPGDTFTKISREVYGSDRYATLIFEANRAVITTPRALRAGQTIKIPKLPGR